MPQERTKSNSSTAQDPLERAKLAARYLTGVVLLALLLLLVYSLASQSLQAALVLGFAGLASLAVGALVGFLFALPKASGGSEPSPERDDVLVVHSVNTNLYEVADWLTKMIVGLGLLELRDFPGWLWRVSGNLGDGITAGREILTVAVPLFAVCGFLLGYIKTRLDLGQAFAHADVQTIGMSMRKEVERAIQEQAQLDVASVELVAKALRGQEDPSPERIKSAIESASPTARADIARMTQEQSRSGRQVLESEAGIPEGEKQMAFQAIRQALPVLKALAEINPHYPTNHVELGFSLAIVGEKASELELAVSSMTTAIEMSGGERPLGGPYQIARAIASSKLVGLTDELSEAERSELQAQMERDRTSVEANPKYADLMSRYFELVS